MLFNSINSILHKYVNVQIKYFCVILIKKKKLRRSQKYSNHENGLNMKCPMKRIMTHYTYNVMFVSQKFQFPNVYETLRIKV